MIRFFVRLLLPVLLILFLRSLIRAVLDGWRAASNLTRNPSGQSAPAPGSPRGGSVELKKDPVCGIYVSAASSLSKVVDGRTLYFCSEECRKKFAATAS